MNCQEYKGMIEDALDVSLQGELKANIRRHLEHCSECREYLTKRRLEHTALFAGVNAAYSHLRQPSADFADRLAESVRNRRGAWRGWRRLALPRWALIAASVAAMAGFVFAASVAVEAIFGGGDEADEREWMNVTEETGATGVEVADVAATIPSDSSGPSTKISDHQHETNQKGETPMIKVRAATAALTVAMAAAPLAAANGDEYPFILSGDPVAAATAGSSSSSSATASLAVGTLSDGFVYGLEFEARSRTTDDSNLSSLRSDPSRGIILTFR